MKYLFWIIIAFVLGVIFGFDGADNMWKGAFERHTQARKKQHGSINYRKGQ